MPGLIPKKTDTPPPAIPARGIAGFRRLAPIFDYIFGALGLNISFDDLDAQGIFGGVHLKSKGQVAAGNFIGSWDGTTVHVTPGTFNGLTPTIDGQPMDTPVAGVFPGLAYGGSGTLEVYLVITTTLSASNNYVYAWLLTDGDVTVESGSTVPADDREAGVYSLPLFTYIDGVRTAQNVSTSLNGFAEDDDSGTSKALLSWFRS